MSHNSLKTDVLVVGSGPIGSTFARLLVPTGRQVTMIDAGAQLSSRPGYHIGNDFIYQQEPNLFADVWSTHLQEYSAPSGSDYLPNLDASAYSPQVKRVNFENPCQKARLNMPYAAATYAVGGMGTHWTACTPTPVRRERTNLIAEDEWAKMLPIARKLFNVRNDAFKPSFLSEAVLEALQVAGHEMDYLDLGCEKRGVDSETAHLVTWTGADTVLGPLASDPTGHAGAGRFQILQEHRAQRLVKDGNRIDYVEVTDLRNMTTRKIYAETVILACNPFLNPRLLWMSGEAFRLPALGRYLNENTISACQVVISNEIAQALKDNPDNPARSETIPIAWNQPEPRLGKRPTDDKPWHVQMHRVGRLSSYAQPIDIRLVVQHLWFGFVEPRSDNYVSFSDEYLDRFGMPQVTINYSLSDADARAAHRMIKDMVGAALAMGGFQPDSAPNFQVPGSSLHFQSTHRMGNDGDDTTSVVDTDLKMWGIDNLYVAGVGSIPNAMADNPTLTACAIAVRAIAKMSDQTYDELAQEVGISLS